VKDLAGSANTRLKTSTKLSTAGPTRARSFVAL
jgi:hypothetical protein